MAIIEGEAHCTPSGYVLDNMAGAPEAVRRAQARQNENGGMGGQSGMFAAGNVIPQSMRVEDEDDVLEAYERQNSFDRLVEYFLYMDGDTRNKWLTAGLVFESGLLIGYLFGKIGKK